MTANPHAPKDRLLLIVDAQQDFVLPKGRFHVPGAETLLSRLPRYLMGLDYRHYNGVCFTQDRSCWYGAAGWMQIVSHELIPQDIYHWGYGKNGADMWAAGDSLVRPWYGGLDEIETGAREREKFFQGFVGNTIEVAGVGVGVDHAIRGLIERKLKVEVIAALTTQTYFDSYWESPFYSVGWQTRPVGHARQRGKYQQSNDFESRELRVGKG